MKATQALLSLPHMSLISRFFRLRRILGEALLRILSGTPKELQLHGHVPKTSEPLKESHNSPLRGSRLSALPTATQKAVRKPKVQRPSKAHEQTRPHCKNQQDGEKRQSLGARDVHQRWRQRKDMYINAVELKAGPISALFSVKNRSKFLVFLFFCF